VGWQCCVSDVTHDSRQAKGGSLFAAVRGELFDAHKFVPQVMEQGAVGVISEQERPQISAEPGFRSKTFVARWPWPRPKSNTIRHAN
jgi:UDP-N-acetylmuramyl pentapeptide synthase